MGSWRVLSWPRRFWQQWVGSGSDYSGSRSPDRTTQPQSAGPLLNQGHREVEGHGAVVLSGLFEADLAWGIQSLGMPELEIIISGSNDFEDDDETVDLGVCDSILAPDELSERILSSRVILSELTTLDQG